MTLLTAVLSAVRPLLRHPRFTLGVVLLLSAGTGTTTAMFSLIAALVWRPLPYPHPEELSVMREAADYGDYLTWKTETPGLAAIAAMNCQNANLAQDGFMPEYVLAGSVTPDFFPLLGIEPLQGRLLQETDGRPDAPQVAVISAQLWHRRFGSRPDALGRVIRIDSVPYAIVGVAPEGFRLVHPRQEGGDVWIPLRRVAAVDRQYVSRDLTLLLRRKSTVSQEEVHRELSVVATKLDQPRTNGAVFGRNGLPLEDLRTALGGKSKSVALLLFGAVTFVHLVICANVANLLLTRAASRRAEMAMRSALGATRARLMVQLTTETLFLFLLSSALGWLLARGLSLQFFDGMLDDSARLIPHSLDGLAFAFSASTCAVLGLVIGASTAFSASKVDPSVALKEGAVGTIGSRSHARARSALVVLQMALAAALLIGASSMLRAFHRLAAIEPGFRPNGLVAASVDFSAGTSLSADGLRTFYTRALADLAARPEVTSVAATGSLPMASGYSMTLAQHEGRPAPADSMENVIEQTVVTAGYFSTMGIPLLRGRDFTDGEGGRVMVINRLAQERFFPDEDPIGKRMWVMQTRAFHEIVGVVGNVRQYRLGEPLHPAAYLPFAQAPTRSMSLVALTRNQDVTMRAIPELLARINPDQAASRVASMYTLVRDSIGREQRSATLAALFATAALLLATLGMYGLVSYSTAQRTREFGLRMALGATRERVLGLVIATGLRLTGVGIGIGVLGGYAIGRVVAERVAHTEAFDGPVFVAVPLLLALTSVLACMAPALRAVRIAPSNALR